MKKIIIVIFVIVVIMVGSGFFYGGIKYNQSKSPAGGRLANLSEEQRQVRFQQMGGANVGGQRAAGGGSSFAAGEIMSKDANSVIVKFNDGGSKIMLFSTSTQVMKFSAGSSSDLVVGENITINGTANQDGSITAQSIQLRPKPAGPAVSPQLGQ